MKKFLVLLLLILPFQFSWAVASAYCQHETGKASHHFGHHFHQHQAQAEASGAKAKDSTVKADNDCGFCHLAVPMPITPDVPQWTASLAKTYAIPIPIHFSSHIPEGPSRPDRRSVA